MAKIRLARYILTFVLLGGSIMSFILDWSNNHLLNPLWHPHARFHGAILLFFFAGVAGVGTWLLWRDSREPAIAFHAAVLLSLSFWLPYFYVPFFLPQASYWAGIPGHEPRIAGVIVYPNLIVVGIFALLTIVGWALGTSAARLTSR